MNKFVSLVNQTREDTNVNDHLISPHYDIIFDPRTPRDIIDDVIILPNSSISFPHACKCEEGKIYEDDGSVHADQYDEWYISYEGEVFEEDVSELSPSNIELIEPIPQCSDLSANASILPPFPT